SGPHTSPIARPVERPARPKSTSQAKARAKARKAKAPKVVRPRLSERLAARLASIDLRPRTLASKVPFVVLVIGALGVGLGLTLWLSTDSAERSYKLSHAREKTRLLQQQKEALERDVREAESAPALAEAARKQGMIPTRDTAHLVQDPSGNWVVVGTPKPADGVPPPPLNNKLPEQGPPPPPAPPPAEVPVRMQP
ncbi:membrane protein, partial [Mycobacterium nebraskense]